MTTSNYPGALDALTDVPANQAELPTHPTQHNMAHAAINALQETLGLNPQGDAATVKARLDAITAALTFTEVTTGAVAESGWTLIGFKVYISADRTLINVEVDVERTGSSFTVSSVGDVPNTVLVTLPPACRGLLTVPLSTFVTGRMAAAYLAGPTGEVKLAAVAGAGNSIDIGERIRVNGFGYLGGSA